MPANVTFIGTYHAFANARGRIYERTTGASPSAGSATASLAVPNANTTSLVASALFTSSRMVVQSLNMMQL